ncbi:MAG: polyamine aminopropyltransferase [Planctomycetota bacterium]
MRLSLAFVTVFLIAACGLGYQLIAGSVSSYLLGDSVTQFSLTIGLYLFALGIGSFLSKYLAEDALVERFIAIELAVAIAGGFSALVLQLSFASEVWFRPVLTTTILVVGTLVGIEIPLLVRILKDELELKDLLARVLAFDYVGALAVALVFPLVLVPRLGLVRSALVLGLVNALVGAWSVSIFRTRLVRTGWLRLQAGVCVAMLLLGLAFAERLSFLGEHELYANEIVHAETSPYQRVVVTRARTGFQLFLNGSLQFSSDDEYRYHEALVHPAMAAAAEPRRVLVLGGGDGLAVREVLRHPEVERVTLVDLDRAVTDLARSFPPLVTLNGDSLADPRVNVVNDDAMSWLAEQPGTFDVVLVDFPDPHSFSVGKLYTQTFYERLIAHLADDGALAVQATNPRLAPKSFWCIVRTLESVELVAKPYCAGVPSFGEWGFVLARKARFEPPTRLPDGLRFLNPEYLARLFVLPQDVQPVAVELNKLSTQALVRYYEGEASP